MKLLRLILGVLAAAFPLTVAAPARGAEAAPFPLEGTWRWHFTMPDGTASRPKLKLKLENGQIAGITSFRPGTEVAITNAILQGDRFTFQVIRPRGSQEIVTKYSGIWTSNTIKGRIESNWAGDKQFFDWDAQRAYLGIEGTWRWTNSFFNFGGFGGRGGGGGSVTEPAQGGDSPSRTNRPPEGRGGAGGRGRGGNRGGFDTRVELEQSGEKVTGKTVARFGRASLSITNGVYTNGFVYFEIERTFGETRTVTKHHGRHTSDRIKGTLEQEVDGEDRVIDWEATRVD